MNRLAFLYTRDKKNPFCKISHNKLAKKVRVSRITIIRHLKWLLDVNAVSWKNRTNRQGGKIENEYVFELDKSKPQNKANDTSHVSNPCNTHVSRDTCYARAYTTFNDSMYTTPCQCTTSCKRPNHCARQEKKSTARRKLQTPPTENINFAEIKCGDGSVFPLTESFLTDMAPHYESINLRALLVDLASWYEEHPDKRTSRSVLMQDLQKRIPEWIAMDKYKQTE